MLKYIGGFVLGIIASLIFSMPAGLIGFLSGIWMGAILGLLLILVTVGVKIKKICDNATDELTSKSSEFIISVAEQIVKRHRKGVVNE